MDPHLVLVLAIRELQEAGVSSMEALNKKIDTKKIDAITKESKLSRRQLFDMYWDKTAEMLKKPLEVALLDRTIRLDEMIELLRTTTEQVKVRNYAHAWSLKEFLDRSVTAPTEKQREASIAELIDELDSLGSDVTRLTELHNEVYGTECDVD